MRERFVEFYEPDLNPDEGIWNYLKPVELGNVCCHDLADLTEQRLRNLPEIIHARSRQCGYSIWFVATRSVN